MVWANFIILRGGSKTLTATTWRGFENFLFMKEKVQNFKFHTFLNISFSGNKNNISFHIFHVHVAVYLRITRPSVNHAKDRLGQLFLIPGLIWSGKGCHLWMWSVWVSQQRLPCKFGHFGMVTTKHPTNPHASLLLTRQGTSSQYQYCYLYLVIWYYFSAQPIQYK